MLTTLWPADCLDVLDCLPSNSIDSCVTDPPYALVSIAKRFGAENAAPAKAGTVYARASAGFMGKQWDTGECAFAIDFWRDVWRVLKPGAYVLAFGGTRTYHRLACAIEDAGFEIRDQIGWVYGSGFPKSHNLEGEWEGWGTALKPAWEPIVLARKPLIGTVAANVERWRTGALNVGACRIPGAKPDTTRGAGGQHGRFGEIGAMDRIFDDGLGRWPANLIHDGSDEVLAAFPQAPGQQGDLVGHSRDRKSKGIFGDMPPARDAIARRDTGSAARFFYCAKASKKDRDEGLDTFIPTTTTDGRQASVDNPYLRGETTRKNTHPTVKPTELMRYLCRLVTPPGGFVLDPFMGSGSTGKAAVLDGFQFIGIEREPEYYRIAEARIAHARRVLEESFG